MFSDKKDILVLKYTSAVSDRAVDTTRIATAHCEINETRDTSDTSDTIDTSDTGDSTGSASTLPVLGLLAGITRP